MNSPAVKTSISAGSVRTSLTRTRTSISDWLPHMPSASDTSTTLGGRFTNEKHSAWSPHQRFVASIIGHRVFETALALLVCGSLVLAVVEADSKPEGGPPVWCKPLENSLLLLYCIEVGLRAYVLRTSLFHTSLNVLDLAIVIVDAVLFLLGLVLEELPNVGFLRVLRLLKLTRAHHIIRHQPELYILVEGMLGSMKTIFFGTLLICVSLVGYGIVAVEFLHPLAEVYPDDCPRCPRAFESVYGSVCTFFQTVVVGDAWGVIFLPLFEQHPLTLALGMPVYVTISFGIMNLMMAVIVDSAAQARRKNAKAIAEQKSAESERNKRNLIKICKELDTDGNGWLNLEEMIQGYESHREFRHLLNSMDVSHDDL